MQSNRRELLVFGAAGFVGLAAAGGFLWATSGAPNGRTPLAHALERARSLSKPVLVLVVPEPPADSSRLADAFAEALERGGDELLAELLLCELVCASPSQYSDATNSVAAVDQLLWIECATQADRARALEFDLTPWSYADEQRSDARLDANVRSLRAALGAAGEELERRALSCRVALGPERVSELQARLARGDALELRALVDAAALVRAHYVRAAETQQLQSLARDYWDENSVLGARWVESFGCGESAPTPLASDSAAVRAEIERRADVGFDVPYEFFGVTIPWLTRRVPMAGGACGMASNGSGATRFLFLYVDEPGGFAAR
jgi:hypothetical protein